MLLQTPRIRDDPSEWKIGTASDILFFELGPWKSFLFRLLAPQHISPHLIIYQKGFLQTHSLSLDRVFFIEFSSFDRSYFSC
jgi:hypothetical protein